VRDDIALIIDQLRGGNPVVRIHLCNVLPTAQANRSLQGRIAELNALLPELAASKSASVPGSPVWVADTSAGFDPAAFTHDQVHPNTEGEILVGDRIAASLGLVESALPGGPDNTVAAVAEKAVESFSRRFEGDAIFDGSAFINGWTEVTPAATTEALVGENLSDLRRLHVNGAGAWLEGTGSGWGAVNRGSWTFEVGVKVHAAAQGVALWLGTGSDLVVIQCYDNRTRAESGSFSVEHANADGAFHSFRIAHDAPGRSYHVWRDGVRLTPVPGVAYDYANDDGRLIIGDSTGGVSGDNYDIEIDYVAYDGGGAFLPPGADADSDGLPDAWEFRHFGDVVAADPSGDPDGDGYSNSAEYTADTAPDNPASFPAAGGLDEVEPGAWRVRVPGTSPDRRYTLFASDGAGGELSWVQVGEGVFGNDAEIEFFHRYPPGVPSGFFRVEISIP
jgi:hypothetical protein